MTKAEILAAAGLTDEEYDAWLIDRMPKGTEGSDSRKIWDAHQKIQALSPVTATSGAIVENIQADVLTDAFGSSEDQMEAMQAQVGMNEALDSLVKAVRAEQPQDPDDQATVAAYYLQYGYEGEEVDEEGAAAAAVKELEYALAASITIEGDQGFTFEALDAGLDAGLAWIFSGETGVIGTPPTIDYLALADHGQLMFPHLLPDGALEYTGFGADTLTDEQRRIAGVKEFFSYENPATKMIVQDWAQSNDLYMSKEDQDAFRLYEAIDHELTFPQSKSLIASASAAGLDTGLAWMVYSIAKETGIHVTDPWTGKSQASIDAEAKYAQKDKEPITEDSDAYAKAWYPPEATDAYAKAWYPPTTGVDEAPFSTMWGEGLTLGQVEGEITVGMLWDKFLGGMDQYGSELVSMVALHSPDLATRMHADPHSLTGEEWQEVDRMISGAENWLNMPGVGAQAKFIQDRLSGAKDVVSVSSADVHEAARTLASSWNMPGLSDGLLRSIATGQQSAILSSLKAAQGNPFQPSLGGPVAVELPSNVAAVARALRGTPEYASLFANMRSGESEVEYAGRFDAAVAQFMGDTDPVLARTGMRSGSPETVGQNALATGAAFDNSTFMERLTGLGNVFRSGT